MASTTERDERLLSVGQQCHHQQCLLVDFLPFRCQHCQESFCGDHFKVDDHKCPNYDESKHNRVAPSCPLCHEPVAIPLNEDPNIRMERHINTQCSVMTGRKQKKSAPVCAKGKCGKVLFAPINCRTCKQQFCPQHRFPADHGCGHSSVPVLTPSKATSQQISEMSSKASATSSAALEAVKRKWTATPAASGSKPAASQPTTSSLSSSSPNLFSKADRSSPPSSPTSSPLTILVTDSALSKPSSPITEILPTPTIKPEPIIDPLAFIPHSVFASA